MHDVRPDEPPPACARQQNKGRAVSPGSGTKRHDEPPPVCARQQNGDRAAPPGSGTKQRGVCGSQINEGSEMNRPAPSVGPRENCSLVLIRRLRSQGGSNFCYFLAEVRKRCHSQCRDTLMCRPALPLASECFLPWGCPFPGVWNMLEHEPQSRRRQQRWKRERDMQELVNVTVLFLNWMHANSRFDWGLVALSASPCTDKQLQYLQPLRAQLHAWCRSTSPLPVDGGLSSLLSALRERGQKTNGLMQYSMLNVTDDLALTIASGTQKLTPTNMSLPKVSGQTPLVAPTVPVEIEKILSSEGAFLRDEEPEALPRTYTSISSWSAIASEMIERNL
eukprot:5529771-Amphidinium_carterae.1